MEIMPQALCLGYNIPTPGINHQRTCLLSSTYISHFYQFRLFRPTHSAICLASPRLELDIQKLFGNDLAFTLSVLLSNPSLSFHTH